MEDKRNLVDILNDKGMLNFVMASLISSDTLLDSDSCLKSLDTLNFLMRDFKSSKLKDDVELRNRFTEMQNIIEKDFERFSDGK